ncbi:hypothetical protein COV89_03880 [Candidatus Shapirobacteria bacterium CG11_big_fil_rev_8_21_14_0_20_40_12]|uniref:J domain-containing protein n=2 Tax=Candidatus Shapironibacteriota TaxID=1752721 RepID=A0A2M8GG39_9BACT|nr:MAG: hypothetical protein COV89_03880 [Candidatus Shapirobacteria bacterium CG11_big_fil_rev_8_21_14_0_20_40_12]PJC76311.1 MAG: hypothetical protein CO010_02910 [Candidatus Shapirobacteria bacterium CG_4_8_14_3_um_filter_39_11]
MAKTSKKSALIIFSILFSLLIVGTAGIFYFKNRKIQTKTEQSSSRNIKDKYVSFLFEVYDTIQKNYWDKIKDEQLINLYLLGAEKLTGKKQEIAVKDQKNLEKLLLQNIKEINEEEKKKEFTATLVDIVLANLQPFGRSRLYSQKEEVDLKNRVKNINPEIDQYQVLEVKKDASAEEIKKAFEDKSSQLKTDTSDEGQQKLAQVNKAYEMLSDEKNRAIYNESGAEPTMEYKLLTPQIFYLHIKQFSPTTIEELVNVTQKVDKGETLDTLILDLRDNVGGAIDGLPYFLGPFIGNDQYAYQFFHQDVKEDFKTKIGWLPTLVRFKKVVVLVNENAQSSAEVMAAVLKKYNVGILVGTATKGWGTVERVFTLNNQFDPNTKYSVFLVHSLTLRDDNQPIEGKGVEPNINIKNEGWENELTKRFNSPVLTQKIKEIVADKN